MQEQGGIGAVPYVFLQYLAERLVLFAFLLACHLNPAITWHSPVKTGTEAGLACPFSCSAEHNYARAENGLPPCLCARLASLGAQTIAGFRFQFLRKQKRPSAFSLELRDSSRVSALFPKVCHKKQEKFYTTL
jgi:hypothetical protein